MSKTNNPMETKEQCPNYEMFSQQGNRKCFTLVKNISKKIRTSKKLLTNEQIELWIREGMNKIQTKHPEVWDTEPRYHIVSQINKVVQERYERVYNLNHYL